MPALPQKDWHNSDLPHAIGNLLLHQLWQIRRHQFKKCQRHVDLWQTALRERAQTLKRLGPGRVARTMRKQDQCLLCRHQCRSTQRKATIAMSMNKVLGSAAVRNGGQALSK